MTVKEEAPDHQSPKGVSGFRLMLHGGDITAGPSPFYDTLGKLQEEAFIQVVLEQDPDLTSDNFLDKYGTAREQVRAAMEEGNIQSVLPEGLDPDTVWAEALESARQFGAEATSMAMESPRRS